MLAALLSSATLQEEKQDLQKDALSNRSSTESTLYQDERETIPKNTFWIKKKISIFNTSPTGASLVAQLVKNPLAMQKTWVRSLGWEDPLKKGTATHFSILAWRIPWTIVHGVTKIQT